MTTSDGAARPRMENRLRLCGAPLALGVGLLTTTALTSPAVAQINPQAERIVVTAERRETDLQDTPISVLAFTPAVMESQGIEDLQDLSRFAPNLTISGSRGTGDNQPTFMIRGISGGGGATSERGVALYIDGIFVPRTNGSIFSVLDMERIEVLRGPQGTLFGRNSTGGAIRMFSAQPSEEHEGYIRATVGERERTDLIGMVNLPVSDRFFLRLQGGYLSEDGWVDRGPTTLGGSEDWVGRAQAKALLTDDLDVTFGLLYSDSQSGGSPQDVETFDMRPGIEGVWDGNFADWLSDALEADGQAPIAALNDPRIVLDDFTMPGFCLLDDFDPDWDDACELKNDSVYWQADATVNWSLSDTLSLTSITGAAEMDHEGLTSWQQLGFETRPDNVKSEVLFQELQLNAALFGGAVDFVTGVNFFTEDATSSGEVYTRRGSSIAPEGAPAASNDLNGDGVPDNWPVGVPWGGPFNNDRDQDGVLGRAMGDTVGVPVLPGHAGPNGTFVTDSNMINQESTSWGWFNSATWHMTDAANLTLGARVAYDEKEFESTTFRSANFTPVAGTDSTTVTTGDDWTEVDWRATLDYHFTDELMAYATVSKAYRAGQFSFTTLSNVPGPAQSGDFIKAIPPEEVINYEVGARTEFAGGRLVINPTVYFMEWGNRQAARQLTCAAAGVPTAECPVGFVIRVVDSGDVDTYGAEIDGQLRLTDSLSLFAAYGYSDYELKDPVANSGPYLFPEPPTHSGSAGALYNMALGASGDLDFSMSYAYVGEQRTHPTSGTDSDYLLPDYGLVNGRVQWNSPGGRYSLALFANNLLDETYATYATSFGGGFWDAGPSVGGAAPQRSSVNVVRGEPRQVGLTLQVNF